MVGFSATEPISSYLVLMFIKLRRDHSPTWSAVNCMWLMFEWCIISVSVTSSINLKVGIIMLKSLMNLQFRNARTILFSLRNPDTWIIHSSSSVEDWIFIQDPPILCAWSPWAALKGARGNACPRAPAFAPVCPPFDFGKREITRLPYINGRPLALAPAFALCPHPTAAAYESRSDHADHPSW